MAVTGGLSVRVLPPEDRPRERLLRSGAAGLSSVELLSVILGTGSRAYSATEVAGRLLATFGSLQALGHAAPEELAGVAGIGPAKAGAVLAAFELGRRAQLAPPRRRASVRGPGDVATLLAGRLRHLDREHFCTVLLNTRHEVLEIAGVAVGGLDSAQIHPREVFKDAIRRSAAALVLVHNHPSGDPEPSGDDLRITGRLEQAGRVVGIEVLDHVIVGDGRFVSLRERGVLSG